ncbi:MAG: DUF1549 domain-containing protein, partial [Lentisphaeraceae bacterium]|nr:DUF1549 domain-containing protein [Lentisphaeraceae bacterium]
MYKYFFSALLLIASSSAADKVDFKNDIRPILSDKCFNCHGPDGGEYGEKWEAGLRLDIRSGALGNLSKVKHETKIRKYKAIGKDASRLKLRGARFAIVVGNPEESSLIERVETADEDDVMPPLDSGLKLTAKEKDLLRRWVEQGAQWDEHWSFKPIGKPQVPQINDKWQKNEIDAFVLQKLQSEKISPAKQPDKATLLRRVSLDLNGLPPTPKQRRDFLNNKSPQAYEELVDSLLSSDAHAEHLTREWLDNARYADTNGYQYDKVRTM